MRFIILIALYRLIFNKIVKFRAPLLSLFGTRAETAPEEARCPIPFVHGMLYVISSAERPGSRMR
jgi:hypothetical protein